MKVQQLLRLNLPVILEKLITCNPVEIETFLFPHNIEQTWLYDSSEFRSLEVSDKFSEFFQNIFENFEYKCMRCFKVYHHETSRDSKDNFAAVNRTNFSI